MTLPHRGFARARLMVLRLGRRDLSLVGCHSKPACPTRGLIDPAATGGGSARRRESMPNILTRATDTAIWTTVALGPGVWACQIGRVTDRRPRRPRQRRTSKKSVRPVGPSERQSSASSAAPSTSTLRPVSDEAPGLADPLQAGRNHRWCQLPESVDRQVRASGRRRSDAPILVTGL